MKVRHVEGPQRTTIIAMVNLVHTKIPEVKRNGYARTMGQMYISADDIENARKRFIFRLESYQLSAWSRICSP